MEFHELNFPPKNESFIASMPIQNAQMQVTACARDIKIVVVKKEIEASSHVFIHFCWLCFGSVECYV